MRGTSRSPTGYERLVNGQWVTVNEDGSPYTPPAQQELSTVDPSFTQTQAFQSGFGQGTQPASFSISPGLQQAFGGRRVSQPRQLPSIGAPPFLSLQQEANLIPSERSMRLAEIQAQGFPLEDFLEQEQALRPKRTIERPFSFAARRIPRGGL